MPDKVSAPRYFRRASIWLPTWRTWIALLLAAFTLAWIIRQHLHSFLSLESRVIPDILVVEGWLPDYALRDAVDEFNRGTYRYLIASGGPMERGTLVSGYPTYAAIAAASLRRMGLPQDKILEAPAPPTYRNRTYVSAVSVRTFLDQQHLAPRSLTVVSEGPHARRTHTVYTKVAHGDYPVGILTIRPRSYDPDHWYASSDGLKTTFAEALGWIYEWSFDSGR